MRSQVGTREANGSSKTGVGGYEKGQLTNSVILERWATVLVRTLRILPDRYFIVCHFCSSRRFEPLSAAERRKFQAENSSPRPRSHEPLLIRRTSP